MKLHEFENRINALLTDTEETINIDSLIEGIHGPKKRSSKGLWWFAFFILFTSAGLLGLNTVIEKNHVPVSESTDSEFFLTASQDSEILLEKEAVATEESASLLEEKAIDSNSSKNNTDALKANTPAKYLERKSENDLTQDSYIQLNTQIKNSNIKTNSIKFKNTSILKNQNSSKKSFSPAISQNSDSQINLSQKQTNERSSISLLSLSARKINEIESLSKLGLRPLPKVTYTECPSFSEKLKIDFDIIPEIGYIVPVKTLSTSNQNEVFTARDQIEQPLEAIQAGLYTRLRAQGKPYYLKFGATYTRLSERMKLEFTEIQRDTTVGIISITESQNGDTLTVIRGDIISETEIYHKSTDHYFLKYIDIPVAIGYSRSIGNGWRVGGEVGAIFNISLSSSGKLLETPTSYTELPTDGRFKNNLGLSYFGGFTFEKSLGHGALFLSPRFRYFPSQVSAEGYTISQKYQFAGIHAGYIFTF